MFIVFAFIVLAVVIWITCVEIRLHILYKRSQKWEAKNVRKRDTKV